LRFLASNRSVVDCAASDSVSGVAGFGFGAAGGAARGEEGGSFTGPVRPGVGGFAHFFFEPQ